MRQIALFSLLFIICLIGCQTSTANYQNQTTTNDQESPTLIVKQFFQLEGAGESSAKLVRHYPDRYIECTLVTPEQCEIERAESKRLEEQRQKNSNEKFVVAKAPKETSSIIGLYQERIRKKENKLIRVLDEWVSNDEARVRAEVDANGMKIIKDFLLYKEPKWQIIEIVEIDTDLHFASPTKKSS